MSVRGDEGKKLSKGDGAMAEREMITFFGGVVVEVDANDAGG